MKLLIKILFFVTIITFGGCAFFKNKPPVYSIDLVCGMKVSETEAFTYDYKGTTYYFDNVNCKNSFVMNPQKFIDNKCTSPK